jgi:subtilisin family serine protease/N-acetylneuraminic acid mutarotase
MKRYFFYASVCLVFFFFLATAAPMAFADKTSQPPAPEPTRPLPAEQTEKLSDGVGGKETAVTGQENPVTNTPLRTPLDIPGLLDKAQTEGQVRIIVGLDVLYVPEGNLPDQTAVNRQQSQIAQMQDAVLASLSGTVTVNARYQFIPFMALTVDETALRDLVKSPKVNYIQEDRLSAPQLGNSIPLIGGDQVHADGLTGSGWVVAILDSGVQWDHEFLGGSAASRIVDEACFSTTNAADGATSLCAPAPHVANSNTALCQDGSTNICAHGTHVAGIAAGSHQLASVAYDGVAPGAGIFPVQVFSRFPLSVCSPYGYTTACVLSYESDQISGLQEIYNQRSNFNIAAVNMSLGGGRYYNEAACDTAEAPTKVAIDLLRSVNIATVISSGNSGYKDSIGAPGCISTAVAVGATDDSDTVASFSNSSSMVELLAPGVAIDSSVAPDNGLIYDTYSGTSMSAPHVTGAWALIKQMNPTATVADVLNTLQSTGVTIIDTNGLGLPRIQLDAAVATLPAGTISGVVTDANTGNPIPYATVSASGPVQLSGETDGSGVYSLRAPAGVYGVTAVAFAYQPATVNNVNVSNNVTTTQNFALTSATTYQVSGVVTDATTGWPLYARIDIPGYPYGPVWTNPETGAYSVQLPGAVVYNFTASAWATGYNSATNPVGPLSGNATRNFNLTANTLTCNAPGYTSTTTSIFSHSFEGTGTTFPSDNWAQVDTSGTAGDWTRPASGAYPTASPHTGTRLAMFNSYTAVAGNQTRLYRQTGLNLSSYTSPVASFWLFNGSCGYTGNDTIQLQISTNGGTIWNNVGSPVARLDSGGWQQYSFDISAYGGAGMTNVRLGLLATSGYGCNIFVDDVTVVNRTCSAPASGGLVVGNVYDANTNAGVNDTAVSNQDGYATTSVATPLDPNVADGFYTLFSPSGSKMFTAVHAGYTSAVDSVAVPVNATIRHDFYLGGGLLNYAPSALAVTVPAGDSATLPLTLTNSGTAAATFQINEIGTTTAVGPSWQTMAPLPAGRAFHAVVAADNYLYAIGGTSDAAGTIATNTNFRYDINANTWTTLMPLPVALGSIDSVAVDGKIYVPGDAGTATTYVYDIAGNSWSTIAANGGYSARSQYQVVAIGANVYVLGGIVTSSNTSTNQVWRLDTTTGIWSAGTPMQSSRTSFAAAAINGEIYVAGGVLFPGFTPDMTAEKFNGSSWQSIAGVPTGGGGYTRWSYNADGEGGGKLWLMGGRRDAGWAVLNHAGYYDVAANSWTTSTTIPTLSQGRAYMEGAVAANGYLYVIGGRDSGATAIYGTNERLKVIGDIPWLSETPVSGSIAPATNQVVNTTFDATALVPGQYTGQLNITHNTPSDLPNVPVTLTVVTGYVWNGSQSSAWNNVLNWTPNGVPSGFARVLVDPAYLTGVDWPVLDMNPTVFDLTVAAGAELTIANGRSLTVNGTLTNNGLLRQTIASLPGGTTAEFLRIGGSSGDAYHGLDITPSAAMGAVTVEVRGNQDCTTNPASQPVRRCFAIDPTIDQSATVRFYYLPGEANGNPENGVNVYHWTGSGWELQSGMHTQSNGGTRVGRK